MHLGLLGTQHHRWYEDPQMMLDLFCEEDGLSGNTVLAGEPRHHRFFRCSSLLHVFDESNAKHIFETRSALESRHTSDF